MSWEQPGSSPVHALSFSPVARDVTLALVKRGVRDTVSLMLVWDDPGTTIAHKGWVKRSQYRDT